MLPVTGETALMNALLQLVAGGHSYAVLLPVFIGQRATGAMPFRLLGLEQAVSSQRSAVSPVKAMHRSAAVDRVVRVQVKVGWVTIAPLSS
jgi:hypothetical protein